MARRQAEIQGRGDRSAPGVGQRERRSPVEPHGHPGRQGGHHQHHQLKQMIMKFN